MPSLKVDIANRLFALKQHMGFPDFYRLSESVVKIAETAFVSYEGWDKDELAARSERYRAAKRFHEMLFILMDNAITEGIAEARQRGTDLEQETDADFLKVAVERSADEDYDSRVAGTY